MLDLTTIPLAFYFLNQSMHSLMREYTKPHFTTLDLRELLCPECYETPPEPEEKHFGDIFSLNLQKVLAGLKSNVLGALKRSVNSTMDLD